MANKRISTIQNLLNIMGKFIIPSSKRGMPKNWIYVCEPKIYAAMSDKSKSALISALIAFDYVPHENDETKKLIVVR